VPTERAAHVRSLVDKFNIDCTRAKAKNLLSFLKVCRIFLLVLLCYLLGSVISFGVFVLATVHNLTFSLVVFIATLDQSSFRMF